MPDIAATPPGEEGLARLLSRACQGDAVAFTELYGATKHRVYGEALQVLRNRALAVEVMQEVYLALWQQRAVFDPDRGSAVNWLLLLAHRRAVDKVRAIKASAARDAHHASHSRGREYDETSEVAFARIDADSIGRMLGVLSEVQREAISLAFLRGYTHLEVAEVLDVPLGTVKTRIRDGLQLLRRHVELQHG